MTHKNNKMKNDNKHDIVEVFAGSPLDAEILKSMLSDNDINSFLKDENMGSIAPWQVTAGGVGAVKIVIDSKDLEKAKAVIEAYEKNK